MKLSFSDQSFIHSPALAFLQQKLETYTARLKKIADAESYAAPECSLNLPADELIYQEAEHLLKKMVTPELKYVINIGIGGSNLGAKAIYDALLGYKDSLEPQRFPKMLFADTNESNYLHALVQFLTTQVVSSKELLIFMISKSGGTTETVVNFEVIYAALQKHFPDLATRVVIISDENSALWKRAVASNFAVQSLPARVGGRYSVFSAVGVLPLLACGIDVKSLLNGAKKMRDTCLLHNLSLNPALLSACVQFHFALEGKSIHDTFFFHPQLESVGKWYRQLMAESLGKEQDIDGQVVHAGITPTISIGSTDLHSMAQLYLGGPKDKMTTFVYAHQDNKHITVPDQGVLDGLVENIAGKSTDQIMSAILQGVMLAYQKAELPFFTVKLAAIDAESLGEFLQWKMLEMMYLAQLLNVNAFDQPNVEMYKGETKRILASS